MSLQHPGHVTHAVTHGAAEGQIVLGFAGIVIGGVVVLMGGEAAVAAVGLVTAVVGAGSTISYSINVSMYVGKLIDSITADAVAGHLTTGFPTVFLGPAIMKAARAAPDTSADCAGPHVGWEGSDTVSLGCRPMSRVGDRLKCQGKICEGIMSVAVGGEPSQKGVSLAEADNPWVSGLTLGSDIVGAPGAKGGWKLLAGAGLVGDATGSPIGPAAGAVGTAHDTVSLLRGGH